MLKPSFPVHVPTVPALLAAARSQFGNSECVVTPEGRLTFADLDERSCHVAERLARDGVVKGTRVGLLFPNSVEWIVAWAAATRIGAIAVPVNTFYRAAELAAFLRHADVQMLLGVSRFLRHDYASDLVAAAPELATAPGLPLHLPSLPQLRRVAFSGPDVPAWADRLSFDARDDRLFQLVKAMGDDITPSDALSITYTSGSTGDPKGVVHCHGATIRHAHHLATLSGFGRTTRVWTPMPLFWVGGLVYSFLRAFAGGGCLVTQSVFEPGAALAALAREQVTEVAAWPAATSELTAHPDFARTDLSRLRSGFDAALPTHRRPTDPGLTIKTIGMSETCGPHTFKTTTEAITGAPQAYRGTSGHGIPGLEHRIVDPDTLADLPDGDEGELLVRGYSLMLGIYKRERADVFGPDGWYRTGDRGYFRDGWFFFTGRSGDMIKTKGANVSPAEVERCLLTADSVRLAFVLGVPDDVTGQKVTALVVPASPPGNGATTSSLDIEALRERVRTELASYKVPEDIFEIADSDVPLLGSSKVDRRVLTALARRLSGSAGADRGQARGASSRPA